MMRTLLRILVIVVLLSIELYAVYAVLHPRVSPEYRAYFIDRTTKDWNPTHYPATPEEGIVFGKAGWPDFVRSAYGFSFREDWGRWTDGLLTENPRIVMNRQFSGPLCIEFVARPAYAERGKKVAIALGKNSREITLSDPDPATYRVSFDNAQLGDTLEFRFDGKVPINEDLLPETHDGRRLGLGIVSLKILPSACAQSQAGSHD